MLIDRGMIWTIIPLGLLIWVIGLLCKNFLSKRPYIEIYMSYSLTEPWTTINCTILASSWPTLWSESVDHLDLGMLLCGSWFLLEWTHYERQVCCYIFTNCLNFMPIRNLVEQLRRKFGRKWLLLALFIRLIDFPPDIWQTLWSLESIC